MIRNSLKYLGYLFKHKYYVAEECFKLGVPMRGILHDSSKFRPSEFFIYADYFYGKPKPIRLVSHPSVLTSFYRNIYTQDQLEKKFDYAWLKHQHRNPHHWQYWILEEDSGKTIYLDMPDKYIKEMLADWVGAGKAINGRENGGYQETLSWYKKNKHAIKLSDNTRIKLEKLLRQNVLKEQESISLRNKFQWYK